MILNFPKQPTRRAPHKSQAAGANARVYAIPLARHRPLIQYLATQVLEMSDPDEGEEFLIDYIGKRWDQLYALGVECDEIRVDILNVAAAVRAVVWKARGVASKAAT